MSKSFTKLWVGLFESIGVVASTVLIAECKYHRKEKDDKPIFRDETGRAVEMLSKSSSEDELGVGDYTRKHVKNKKNVKISKELGYASDPEVLQNNKIVTVCTIPVICFPCLL